ncbi:MAG: hypothetical protein PHE17_07350 [Thiothrix sp.]|uniref:hypothetical protein n=1 Tax=Thiothrix sp. TaxID=1032 RepID=UPI0026381722|nr:hypothetical protein [Thiothrix sp.]MDD5392820.1 hypothetical protein [Thiothrix sp.]
MGQCIANVSFSADFLQAVYLVAGVSFVAGLLVAGSVALVWWLYFLPSFPDVDNKTGRQLGAGADLP